MSESGFYKAKDGELLHAPNAVYGKGFTLKREAKLSGEKGLNPPVSGWYWFDTRQDALGHFDKEIDTEEEEKREVRKQGIMTSNFKNKLLRISEVRRNE